MAVVGKALTLESFLGSESFTGRHADAARGANPDA
jgi:hypothetical protein